MKQKEQRKRTWEGAFLSGILLDRICWVLFKYIPRLAAMHIVLTRLCRTLGQRQKHVQFTDENQVHKLYPLGKWKLYWTWSVSPCHKRLLLSSGSSSSSTAALEGMLSWFLGTAVAVVRSCSDTTLSAIFFVELLTYTMRWRIPVHTSPARLNTCSHLISSISISVSLAFPR